MSLIDTTFTNTINDADRFLPKAASLTPVFGMIITTKNVNSLVTAYENACLNQPADYSAPSCIRLYKVINEYRVISLFRNFICIAALATLMGLGIIHGMGPLIASGGGLAVFTAMNIHQAREIYKNKKEIESISFSLRAFE